jgi:hypothetical protein
MLMSPSSSPSSKFAPPQLVVVEAVRRHGRHRPLVLEVVVLVVVALVVVLGEALADFNDAPDKHGGVDSVPLQAL